MSDIADTSRLSREADDHIRHERYAEAADLLKGVTAAPAAVTPAEFLDAWLKIIYCFLMLRQDGKCQEILRQTSDLLAHKFDAGKHYRLAEVMCRASSRGDVQMLRAEAERFSQGFDDFGSSIYPRMLARLDETISGTVDLRVPLAFHNYEITSFSTWKQGLDDLVADRYDAARDQLLLSIKRYDLGDMEGDVLWSWFDAILCYLFLDQPDEAKQLYDRYLPRARSTKPRFEAAAEAVMTAYRSGDVQGIVTARGLVAENWRAFESSQYPAIFDKFATKILAKANRASDAPLVLRDLSPRSARPYGLLKARAAVLTDLKALQDVAEAINLGNTRPHQIRDSIEDSMSTLDGKVKFKQGQIYFCTEMHANGNGNGEVVGGCKLQMLVDACWIRRPRHRVARTAGGRTRSEYLELVYDSTATNALEFGANSVKPNQRGHGIGTFQIQARLLFLLTHGIGDVDYLFADLLTDSQNDKFPFYESVVKGLVGELDYDDADFMRYNDIGFFDSLLGPVEDEPCVRIPLHSLTPEIRANLGSVRDLTKPVQTVLERYGFAKAEKFDILDGGQYFEASLSNIRQRDFDRDLTAVRSTESFDREPWITFGTTSKRKKKEFVAARCRARIDGVKLLLPTDVYQTLEIQRNEPVKVLLDRSGNGNV